MSRSRSLLRSSALVAVATGVVLGLSACFGLPAPTVTVTETVRPEPDFGSIGGDPQPIDTSDPVDPTAPATEGYTQLVDDLGVLTVQVPSDWTDVDGAPFTTESGQEWASIVAAPDIDAYLQTWSESGVEIGATSIADLTDAELTDFLASVSDVYSACDAVETAAPYDDSFYVGFQSAFEDCGGEGTAAFAIVVRDYGGTRGLYVRAQMTSELDPNEVYLAIANSFDSTISRGAARAG